MGTPGRAIRWLLLMLWLPVVGPAIAEDLWIVADPMLPSPGQEIDVRLMSGDGFPGTEMPYSGRRTAMFQHVWNSGRAHLGSIDGAQPASRFRARDAGVHLLAYSTKRTTEAAGASSQFGKLLLVIGDSAPDSPIRFSELGQRLEIVPQTDPVALVRRGGRLELQVLFEREPLAGVSVVAIPAADPGRGNKRATTDEIGLATVRLDRPGSWMIRVAHDGRCADCDTVDTENLVATLTLATR
jgi:hypothetical protein